MSAEVVISCVALGLSLANSALLLVGYLADRRAEK